MKITDRPQPQLPPRLPVNQQPILLPPPPKAPKEETPLPTKIGRILDVKA